MVCSYRENGRPTLRCSHSECLDSYSITLQSLNSRNPSSGFERVYAISLATWDRKAVGKVLWSGLWVILQATWVGQPTVTTDYQVTTVYHGHHNNRLDIPTEDKEGTRFCSLAAGAWLYKWLA